MGSRLTLDALLRSIPGVKKTYFQPPANVQLEYPCIIYRRDRQREHFADNQKYLTHKAYMVTVIDPDPDSAIPDAVNDLPKSSFVRHFVVDRLNHDIYTLFF